MSVADRAVDGTMAMQITYQRIGGYLTRFFPGRGRLCGAAGGICRVGSAEQKTALHRLIFVPGAGLWAAVQLCAAALRRAGRKKYHINQSFTLACRWANNLSRGEWRMGKSAHDDLPSAA